MSSTPFAPLPPSPELVAPLAAKSVLIVDDDRTWLCALSRLLEKEGFQVETATNATAALRTLQQKSVDLIVSDLNMPRMDGLELRDALVSSGTRQAIPFIFVSGSLDSENLAAASSLGVHHFLDKTAPIVELTQLARDLAG
jgi:CheY-like chemotaxis protein